MSSSSSGVEFRETGHHVRFDDGGITVDGELHEWPTIGALGVYGHGARGRGFALRGGAMPGPWLGCLAICLQHDVDVVLAFGVTFDCAREAPSAAERDAAIEYLKRELGDLWKHISAFAPAGQRVQDWWRPHAYGPGSHAHSDAERIEELRAELAAMNHELRRGHPPA